MICELRNPTVLIQVESHVNHCVTEWLSATSFLGAVHDRKVSAAIRIRTPNPHRPERSLVITLADIPVHGHMCMDISTVQRLH